MTNKEIAQLHYLLQELLSRPKEDEWVEFKHNNDDSPMIGEYISALSNSAALYGKPKGYMVWGIEDETQNVVGTAFKPFAVRYKGQEFESWALQKLNPKINFRFYEFEYQNLPIVILEIDAAEHKPVRFDGTEFIRIGSNKKKLRDFPEKERELWRTFDKTPFEKQIAFKSLEADKVLQLLDFSKYFDMTGIPLPQSQQGILEALADDKLIINDSGLWNITNLGALLFSKRLSDFDKLERKAVRIIRYQGDHKFTTLTEIVSNEGYAIGFENIMRSIKALLSSYEEIGLTYRENKNGYPDIALRELVANALIHQDLSISGTSPMIEIFDNRLEITNAGSPLVEVSRFMDKPPRSRNEHLAALMRRVDICEERGTGVDKIIFQTELNQLPAPLFEDVGEYTRAILFTYRDFKDITKEERLRACYWHCVFKYVLREQMSNASLRQRFGNAVSSAMISKIIKEAQEKQLIKVYDNEAGAKAMKYVPYWA